MGRRFFGFSILAVILLGGDFGQLPSSTQSKAPARAREKGAKSSMNAELDTKGLDAATFGAGCFWCVEAVFQRLEGVVKVISGYSGGHTDNPSYEQVCTGTTGHAEVCRIIFDPKKISYDQLLEVFWKTHDPTTENRQGNDVGTQYRSVVFYHSEEQKKLAEDYKSKLAAEQIWNHPIITQILPFKKFWPAEDYHQNYFNSHPERGYCTLVINPKVEKFEKIFKDKLKK